jgi:hypothetical protein
VSDIETLEMLARSISEALQEFEKGPHRNSVVRRLARIDQLIALKKDRAGTLGVHPTVYLDD